MHKKVFGKKLGRNRRSRKALFRSLARAMVLHGKIKTTKAKALALRPELDKLMKLVKKGTLSARREALAVLGNDKEATEVLFKKYQVLAVSRSSGFTKIALLPSRRGDNADMVNIFWSEEPVPIKEEKVKTKVKAEGKKK